MQLPIKPYLFARFEGFFILTPCIIDMQKFSIKSGKGKARTGTLNTAHGKIKTPFFMPVATKAAVKLLSNREILETNTDCMICNSFILSMKPGVEVISKHGGLHKFMNWKKSLFTDSGGFQVLSKKFCLNLSEEGVTFRNPFTGKSMLFTPEKSMEIQTSLGIDVAMCLDDVPVAGSTETRVKEAVERTTRWAQRCFDAHNNKKQMLFGICQGGINEKLRKQSAEEISAIGFDGIAVGGLAIGEPVKGMFKAIETSLKIIPEEKPRYLMGVGSVKEMVKAIALGVDCFDSRFPTRTARHGRAFTSERNINIDSAQYKNDLKPLDKDCKCFVCQSYSKAYIHHLFRTKEENAGKYLGYHNIYFVQNTLAECREAIADGTFTITKILKHA